MTEQITIPVEQATGDDQSYFWIPEWQTVEIEAEEDLRLGRYDIFETGEALLADFVTIMDEGGRMDVIKMLAY